MRVARAAKTVIKEGKGEKYFERLSSLNILNDADIGKLNHSKEFCRQFRKNIFLPCKQTFWTFWVLKIV